MSLLFTDVLVWAPHSPDAVTRSPAVFGDPRAGTIGPTDVLVVADTITEIGDRARPAGAALAATGDTPRTVAGGGRHLLVPGLINAHFHSPANHLAGALPSLPLELFMLYESPADPALAPTPREAYLRTALGALEMLAAGTTSVQDDAFLMPTAEPDIIDAVMAAYADTGMRATLALDQPTLPEADKLPLAEFVPAHLAHAAHAPAPASSEQVLAAYEHLLGRWHGAEAGRLRAAVSVSAPQRVGLDHYAALDDLSRRHDLPLFVHLLETKTQRHLMSTAPRFGGRSLLRWVADAGLLNERTNAIHAVWIDEGDAEALALGGATVIHNPVSNLRLGSGVMPFRMLRDAGVPIALGTDEAICGDAVDTWTAVRAAGLVHNVSGLDAQAWPRAVEVLDALWLGGARAMGAGDRLGRVAVGYQADLALLDLHGVAFSPLTDVAGQLVYCAGGRDVAMTIVAGTVVAEGGRVTSVAADDLLAEARGLFAGKREALAAAARQAAAWYPTYQQVVRAAAGADVGFTRWVGR